MLNKLMMGVALSAFALSGAMAQSNPPANSDKPAMTSPAPSSSSSMDKSSTSTQPSTATTGQQAQTTGGAKIIASQQSSQWLASKFQGTDVVGSDDKKIGDVNDVLFDQNGQIQAYVIGVGGFLGMGSKDVALAPSAFTVVKGDGSNADKLKLSMSKDELKQAQAFEPYKEAPRTTTGSATTPGTMGSTTPRPSTSPSPTSK
jgi:sporulation protein YlmC with PRC-barrel domain